MYQHLELIKRGPVAELWLNRPDRLNALSVGLLREIRAAATDIDLDPDVRVVLVQGRGRAFCAGADLEGFPALEDADLREAADAGRQMADALETMSAIAIAGIHGWCVGGGLVVAAACDLRIATDSARFSIPEIDLGIPLAWGGIPRLVREIGPALTKELVITCREFDSQEALAAGFLNRICSQDRLAEELETMATGIADKPRLPVIATKRHTNAVTANMVGVDRAWGDADSLIGGLLDKECQQAREAYVRERLGG